MSFHCIVIKSEQRDKGNRLIVAIINSYPIEITKTTDSGKNK